MIQKFQEIVAQFPNRNAVFFQKKSYSYNELDQVTNQIARHLSQIGVKQHDRVGLLLNESSEMVIGILAIVKANASYVPMPESFPADRIQSIVEDAKINVLLTRSDVKVPFEILSKVLTVVVLDQVDVSGFSGDDLVCLQRESDCIYSIYTSGSTGKPKGVSISHGNLLCLAEDVIERCQLTELDCGLKYAGYGFDASVLEIFPILLSGGCLHILDKETKLDIQKLKKYLDDYNISYCFLPTQFGEIFIHEYPNQGTLRNLIVGGDKLRKVQKTSYKILNMYGPTETTVAATVFEVDRTDYKNIPIGKPLNHYKIYIVDHHMNLCPVGVSGELCIAGRGVGLGYIDLPKVTQEHFIANPFVTAEERANHQNLVLYRSGDLARWMPCGNIEYLGRADFQVKIRGFRIELGEIENKLCDVEGIDEAIVLAWKDDNDNDFLCAYYSGKKEIPDDILISNLSTHLPDYMVPTAFCWMPSFPINANGKIDRKKLLKPDLQKEEFIPPETPEQKLIHNHMCKILDLNQISIKSNFFHIGGNSLKAVVLVSRLQEKFEIKVSDVFLHKTIEKLAGHLSPKQHHIEIPKTALEKYPLTAAQKGVYFASAMDPDSTIYNLPMAIEFLGSLDKESLGLAIDDVIAKHRILKIKFVFENNDIFQMPDDNIELIKDFQKTRLQELGSLFQEFVKPFDFFKGPLARFKLLQIEENRYTLFMDIHHVISDGLSQNIFLKDLFFFYKKRKNPQSEKQSFKPEQIDYLDYSAFENQPKADDLKEHAKQYWLAQDLTGEKFHIPMDFPETHFSDEGHSLETLIESDFLLKIEQVSKQLGITKYSLFLSAFALLISKFSRSDVVTIGGFFAGRSLPELQGILGMFVATLPISLKWDGQTETHVLVKQVQEKISQIIENQDMSMTELMSLLHLSNVNGRNPFFNNAFNFVELDNYQDESLQTKYLNIAEHKKAHFDLTLSCFQTGDQIKVIFEYSTASYKLETMQTAMDSFLEILNHLVTENARVCHVPFANASQCATILDCFNQTNVFVHNFKTIIERFKDICQQNPNAPAIVFKDQTTSYLQLDNISNCIARALLDQGVKPGDRIGIYLDECPEMISGILAILKCRACYVPMADSFPMERVQMILEDAEIKVLLTKRHMAADQTMDFSSVNLIYLEDLAQKEPLQSAIEHLAPVDLDAPIYSIYTSGSTGRPKGVSITEKNLIYLMSDIIKRCSFSSTSQCLKYMGYAFDASVIEIFPSLLAGACLHIVDKETKLNIIGLRQYFDDHKITFCVLPTQFAEIFMSELEHNTTLECMIIGGDRLRKVRPHHYKVFNMYGPTETTVAATAFEVKNDISEANIPIGKPMENYRAYVVDQHMNLCPIGVAGELCIAGCGVGLGYLHLPKITSERFIENPFVTTQEKKQKQFQKMYRTGDLVRWREDGNLEFIGRIDFQVKINGFRIELGEIETKMMSIPGIKDCVVLCCKDKTGSDFLCAYYVPTASSVQTEAAIAQELSKTLPDYMIPTAFQKMEQFPINPNGKVDRKKLPVPTVEQQAFVAPHDEKEAVIAQTMAEVLGLEEMSTTSNFFHCGGSSLKAVLLVSKLQSQFQIQIGDVFLWKTPKAIAAQVTHHAHGFHLDQRFTQIKQKLTTRSDQEENQSKELLLAQYRERNKQHKFKLNQDNRSMSFPLVTGATGYLGAHLVLELLSQSCDPLAVLVRGTDLEKTKKRLFEILAHYNGAVLPPESQSRIHVFQGDMTEDRFYLSDRDYDFICQNITCVINAAANVKHFGDMEVFYRDNVTSVKKIIHFCIETGCPLHHISTYSVSAVEAQTQDNIDPIFTEDHTRQSHLLKNPYLKTKACAEEEIKKAQNEFGLCANVYRVGNLVFNSQTNQHQINIENNGFYHVLKFLFQVGYCCSYEALDFVELSPVNETAKAIVLIAKQKDIKNETFHVFNENFYKISEIFKNKMYALNLDDFLDKVKSYYESHFSLDNANQYMLHSGWLNQDQSKKEIQIFNERTSDLLNSLEFSWSSICLSNFLEMIDKSFQDRYQILKASSLFQTVEDSFLRDLNLHARLTIIKDGDIVFSNRTNKESIYLILDGFAQLSVMTDAGGWTSSIGVLSVNDMIGIENAVKFENKNVVIDSILGDLVLLEIEKGKIQYFKETESKFIDLILTYALKSLHTSHLLISNFA